MYFNYSINKSNGHSTQFSLQCRTCAVSKKGHYFSFSNKCDFLKKPSNELILEIWGLWNIFDTQARGYSPPPLRDWLSFRNVNKVTFQVFNEDSIWGGVARKTYFLNYHVETCRDMDFDLTMTWVCPHKSLLRRTLVLKCDCLGRLRLGYGIRHLMNGFMFFSQE